MTPTRQQVHINRPLTNISIAYLQDAMNFVAPNVFPNIPVDKESDLYFVYDRAAMNRNQVRKRGLNEEVPLGGFTYSTDQFRVDEYALGIDIPDRTRNNMDLPLNADEDATMWLINQMRVSMEVEWVSQFFTTGVWTGGGRNGVAASPVAGTSVLQWNDNASVPFRDMATAKSEATLASGGIEPNTVVAGYAVTQALQQHPEVIDRVRTVVVNGGGDANKMIEVSEQDLASVFGVGRWLTMKAVQNTAIEGATESNAFIGGKHLLLCYVPQRPSLRTPSAGYTFNWREFAGNGLGLAVQKKRVDLKDSDRISIHRMYTFKRTGADLGYFFNGIVA